MLMIGVEGPELVEAMIPFFEVLLHPHGMIGRGKSKNHLICIGLEFEIGYGSIGARRRHRGESQQQQYPYSSQSVAKHS